LLASGDHRRNLASAAGFWLSDPKIQESLAVERATNKLQCPTVADSHKRGCKNEEFKFRKLFTVFKIVNLFLNIKEVFTVKLKMIFVLTIIFTPTKYKKMPKIFFKNYFIPKQT
jgi:hypothetical protein